MNGRPNIVLLMSDQQRQDSLGCYGNCFVHTKNIDRLAAEGARFENFFTPWPVCTPARATMWTGVYPHKHGITRNVYGSPQEMGAQAEELENLGIVQYGITDALPQIAGERDTVFAHLQDAGYKTAYFGKWHLGSDTPDHMDVWSGFNSLGGHWQDWRDGTYKPDVQTDECIQFFRQQVESDQPFFVVNGYYPPHDPFTAPKQFYDYYRGRGVPFAGYYASVSAVDACVGRTMDALEELDLAKNTIVVFFSDHGETFFYRRRGTHKVVCHEEAIRIPFVVRWPGKIASGAVVDAVCGLQDLMPTILDWAGVPVPDGLDGKSLLGWLKGQTPEGWRQAYYVENRQRFSGADQRCIRTERWKLIVTANGDHELYDLMDDPEEELNLYHAPVDDHHHLLRVVGPYTEVIVQMAKQLLAEARQIDDHCGLELADQVLAEMATRGNG